MSPNNLCMNVNFLTRQVGSHKSRSCEQRHAYGQYELFCVLSAVKLDDSATRIK